MQIKARTTIIPIIALSFLALGAMPQSGDSKGLAVRVQVLETQVQEMKGMMQAQSKAASEMLISLGEAEKAGFTAGINPRSREILMAAWRAQAKASSSSSKTGKKGKGEKPSKRGTTR